MTKKLTQTKHKTKWIMERQQYARIT